VIVGDDPYNPDYVARLRATKDPRILFPGYVFGSGFHQLMAHCRLYVQPSDVEGTSPVLLTAMAHGRPILVNGIPENLHTVGEAGLSWPPGDVDALRRLLLEVLEDDPRLAELGRKAVARVRTEYDWERITDRFAALFTRLAP
jgi:glycosyltransferase involved in cell wall biosynthesis